MKQITTASSILLCLIQEFRECNRWTYDDMSLRLGMWTGTYWKLEHGKFALNMERLMKISSLMNMKLSSLIDHQEKIANILISKGWSVLPEDMITSAKNDSLLSLMADKRQVGFTAVKPEYGSIRLPSIIAQIVGDSTNFLPQDSGLTIAPTGTEQDTEIIQMRHT